MTRDSRLPFPSVLKSDGGTARTMGAERRSLKEGNMTARQIASTTAHTTSTAKAVSVLAGPSYAPATAMPWSPPANWPS